MGLYVVACGASALGFACLLFVVFVPFAIIASTQILYDYSD